MTGRYLLLGIGIVTSATSVFPPKNPPQATSAPSYQKDILPKIKEYCIVCHTGSEPPGGISFDKFKNNQDLATHVQDWDRIVRAIKSQQMPPANWDKKPSNEERAKLVTAIEGILAKSSSDPGRVTVRRLNRAEYKYTVQDLLSLDFDPTVDFPNDDVGYGFDNIGDVLTLSPLLLEKYLEAAEKIAERAILTSKPKTLQVLGEHMSTSEGNSVGPEGERNFFSNGTSYAKFKVLSGGSFRIKIRAFGQQAGPELCKMAVYVDGKLLQNVEVGATQAKPIIYEIPAELETGDREIGIEFKNDYYNANDPNTSNRDRNLLISYVEIEGPIGSPATLPLSHRNLIPSKPAPGEELQTARRYLTSFATRAFRRPVDQKEMDRLMEVVKPAVLQKESFEKVMQVGVTAILCSPSFLFRIEPDNQQKFARDLTDYELATRLSYFLWSSTPDDELLGLASQGKLKDPKVLEAQVDRMRQDPKIRRLATEFAGQWLQLRKLDHISPDRKIYPEYNQNLGRAFRTETYMFFEDIVKNNLSILNFIDSRTTFLNQPLSKYYGIPGVEGNDFKKVTITDQRRGGLLGQASVLMLTSNPTRTSPTKRGRWILEQLLGSGPPPPPPGTPELAPRTEKQTPKSLREQMESHRANPECASCHVLMDPIGFSLENFTGVGSWRDKEAGQPVDASGELPDGTKVNGPVEVRKVLMERKDEFVKTLAANMLTFATGRGMRLSDSAYIDKVVAETKKDDYKMATLIKAVIASDPFKKRGLDAKPTSSSRKGQ